MGLYLNIILAQVALANIPRASWLRQQTFLKIPTDVSGERLLPGLQMAFLLHITSSYGGEQKEEGSREMGEQALSHLLIRALSMFLRTLSS